MAFVGSLLSLTAIVLAIILHEMAHGYAALILGDDTAKKAGRLTLNPLHHIDPFGTVLLPLILVGLNNGIVFGWAKPVPVNFHRLRNNPKDMLIVSGAGVFVNFALAFLAGLILKFMLFLPDILYLFIFYFFISNLILAFFNLLPIPPLDGSKLFLGWINKKWAIQYVSSEYYGLISLMILIIIIPMVGDFLGLSVISPLHWYLSHSLSWFINIIGG